ncbi:endospore germination permease [Bacillaceae bacterium SIJ1]|uniref:GerAB/ArcD/ProY family transporter n=1 Tax=Litoribacterium kuwaitense TaxID=1398745 RepID=UPI0013EBC6E4|nr:endospore germination permease [Litoribacterium kuwaitense]NGP44823.1 endospore germination permease [Litoribacterium kuwaitense]
MPQTHLSKTYLYFLIFTAVMATMILLGPSTVAVHANKDMWFSPLVAVPFGLLVTFLIYLLYRYYPNLTPGQYMIRICGQVVGRLLIVLYFLFIVHYCALVLQEFSIFSSTIFLIETPNAVVMAVMIITASYAVYKGVEVMGRTCSLVLPIYLIIFALGMAFLIPEFDFGNLLPIFPIGVFPSVRGSVPLNAWFTEIYFAAFLLPHLKNRQGVLRGLIVTNLLLCMLMVFVSLTIVLLFGSLAPDFPFPLMSALRYVSIGNFLEHMESIVVVMWFLGVFIKMSVLLYCANSLLNDLFSFKRHEVMVWPLALFVGVVANWSFPTTQFLSHFYQLKVVFYFYIFVIIIPFVLLLMTIVRRWLSSNDSIRPSSS